MMIKETELPGIGRKFEIETSGGNRVVVIIHDDGRGFDITHHQDGLGLQHIQERASTIHADASITSHPNKGTEIQIRWLKKGALE